MIETYLGKITLPVRRGAYARVHIPQESGIPLSVKATYSGFSRNELVKDTVVEMTRGEKDKRRFQIVRIFSPVEAEKETPETIVLDIETRNAAEFRRDQFTTGIKDRDVFTGTVTRLRNISLAAHVREARVIIRGNTQMKVTAYWNTSKGSIKEGDQVKVRFEVNPFSGNARWRFVETQTWKKEEKTMQQSKDRVKFFVGNKYLQISKFYDVLGRAFGLDEQTARKLANLQTTGCHDKWYGGFWIVCRPDQFARFMIYRNDAEITNGFMDLKAELIEPADAIDALARKASVSRTVIEKVLAALNITPEEVCDGANREASEIDVSGN